MAKRSIYESRGQDGPFQFWADNRDEAEMHVAQLNIHEGKGLSSPSFIRYGDDQDSGDIRLVLHDSATKAD